MSSGLSRARLQRVPEALGRYIAEGRLPGAVAAVERRGETHVWALGARDLASGKPMRRDTIFRISSMTKPVTAVAALILVEEALIRLDDPVDAWLPELAERRVLRAPDAALDDTVPAERSITLRDLLTSTFGFGIRMGPGQFPVEKARADAGIVIGPKSDSPHAPDAWIAAFGKLPLMHQPGAKWMYHSSLDVLGVLVARVAGKPFEAFLRERLFGPLGMSDTGFMVPAGKLDRLATAYGADHERGGLLVYDRPEGEWSRPATFPSGGAGLVSTVDDYLAFARMLLGMGRASGGERILARPTVELMTADHLTPAQKAASLFYPGFWEGAGWGFGVWVVTERRGIAETPGRYGWNGGLGTQWRNDPAEGMITLLLTQRLMDGPDATHPGDDFLTAAYAAIDD